MKKVILKEKQKSKKINPDQCSNDKYYGVQVNESQRDRGFIARRPQDSNFYIFSEYRFTNGNGWDFIEGKNLEEFIANCLNRGLRVYEFNTLTKLMKWVEEYKRK